MPYYIRPSKPKSDHYIIKLSVTADMEAYLLSCRRGQVRFAYTKRTAKPFESSMAATRYIEKHGLRGCYPLGCTVLLVRAEKSLAAA